MMGSRGSVAALKCPLTAAAVKKLKAGDLVRITGTVVTARDKAYARILDHLRAGKKLPFKLRGATIYHCGPLVERAPKGWQVLSAGPTTSARLDPMQVEFIERTKTRTLIGKGGVSEDVAKGMKKLGCVYLAFPGGVGVVAARTVKSVENMYWQDLGLAEALWVFRIEDLGPLVVAIDAKGKNLYSRPKPK